MPRKKKAEAESVEQSDDLTPASDGAATRDEINHDGKQTRLPTMERKGNKAIEKAMESVRDFETAKKEAAKSEKESREFLIGLMEREQIDHYEHDGMTAKLSKKTSVQVKDATGELDSDSDEESWEPDDVPDDGLDLTHSDSASEPNADTKPKRGRPSRAKKSAGE